MTDSSSREARLDAAARNVVSSLENFYQEHLPSCNAREEAAPGEPLPCSCGMDDLRDALGMTPDDDVIRLVDEAIASAQVLDEQRLGLRANLLRLAAERVRDRIVGPPRTDEETMAQVTGEDR